jgi:hypothetical protein
MPTAASLIAFALISLGMVLTPGPNMIYLVSRSIAQGPRAGLISLGGVALGFVFYMLSATLGITALLLAVPFAYDALRFAGRSISYTWRGRLSDRAATRRSGCATCRPTARGASSRWGSSPIF